MYIVEKYNIFLFEIISLMWLISSFIPFYSYLPDEMDRIQTWNQRRLSLRTANLRHRCKDMVPKAISSCHLWRTMNLPGIHRRRSIAIQYIILEAVHIQGQGIYNKYNSYFQHAKRSDAVLMYAIFAEGWTDLEVTHPTRYHQRQVVPLPWSLNDRVAPAQRCNNVSKLLEYPLRLPYPVLYEGTSYLCITKKQVKKYISSKYLKKYILIWYTHSHKNDDDWYENNEESID